MSLLLQWMVIGFVVVFMCAGTGVTGDRIRRQNFFFPDDRRFTNRLFSNRFQRQGPFFGQRPSFFQPQGRLPFPSPIQPGPPAIIDSPQPSASTVTPDTVVTTASPAFFACLQNCPTTSEYNPICGTNRQLYLNQQKFDCAIKCGARTEIWRRGSCEGLFAMNRG